MAGGSGPLMSPLPTKLLMGWEDIGTDHPDVPAEFYIYDAYGKGLSQEPQKTIGFLHGCLNLVFILPHRHGEGLSREPYRDNFYLFIWDLFFFNVMARAKPRTLTVQFSLVYWFRDLLYCGSGLDSLFRVHPLTRMFFLWLLFSCLICMWEDSVPDGSLKRSNFV